MALKANVQCPCCKYRWKHKLGATDFLPVLKDLQASCQRELDMYKQCPSEHQAGRTRFAFDTLNLLKEYGYLFFALNPIEIKEGEEEKCVGDWHLD